MITAKFGGTSVADADAVGRLARIVRSDPEVQVVVVSALSGITDTLIACIELAATGRTAEAAGRMAALRARHLTLAAELAVDPGVRAGVGREIDRLADRLATIAPPGPATPAQHDEIVATGEILSSRLVCGALATSGLPASWVDARSVVVTDGEHGKAQPLERETAARLQQTVAPLVAASQVVVIGGFVGATREGVTTTLGRGGSDYSAAIVGAGLRSREIHIWTDVDGMLTADPRVVPTARLVPHLSFAEASELAYFGAKVLHPSTILPAMAHLIPVRILNSRRPEAAGTLITAHAPASLSPLRAIACKRDVTVVTITSTRMLMAHGFLRRVFEVFDRHKTAVDVVTTSEVSVSVTIDDARALDPLATELSVFADVSAERGLAMVCAVGERLRTDFTLCARILHALGGLPLRMVSQASSRQNITFVVSQQDLVAAMDRLHRQFFEEVLPRTGAARPVEHGVQS